MKTRRIFAALAAFSLILLIGGWFLTAQQRDLSQKLIRLHVVANSDTARDQEVKLKVRDAVLAVTNRVTATHPGDARQALADSLPEIERAANACLAAQGSPERAAVTLRRELFPTREYGTFALPAGTYTALRVTIGEGEGHNWWCVVFPSLCMTASMDEFEEAAQTAGLTQDEIGLITEENGGYKLKFRTLELLERLKERLSR